MNILQEDGLEIDFANALSAIKFDQQDSAHPDFHDIQNMPRVDFIVELADCIYFIEIKDPGRPDSLDIGNTSFLKKLEKGTLESSLIEKYLYSFLFRWAEVKLEKSVRFISLITLESALLAPLIDNLEKHLNLLTNNSRRWARSPLASMEVHNLTTWSAVYPDWPIKRITGSIPPGENI